MKLSVRKKLAFVAATLGLTILSAELLLVTLRISFPLLYQPDQYCATRLKPNLNARYCEEGSAIVQTNSAGFRDVEWAKSKSPGVFRIAIVGDSFCEAIQVNREDSVGVQLERELEGHGLTAEVMNFGISGFGTAQEFELLRHYVLDYQPDLVILAVFLGNDVVDNSRTLNPGQIKPYYDLNDDGKLVLDASFTRSAEFIKAMSASTELKAGLINSSRCLQLLNKFYSRWKSRNGRKANVSIGMDPQLYKSPESREWSEAWKVTEALILAFHQECKQSGADCLVVTLTNPIQVHPDSGLQRQYMEEHAIESLFYPDDRLAAFCQDRGIDHLQLARPFHFKVQVLQNDQPIFFHGFRNTEMGTGHWNEQGHQLAAELVANHLVAKKKILADQQNEQQ